MRRLTRLAVSLAALTVLGLAACGEVQETKTAPQYNLVDQDQDGLPDAIDIDGDGVPDVQIDALCEDPLVDADHDGVPEGIDQNCDGTIDVHF